MTRTIRNAAWWLGALWRSLRTLSLIEMRRAQRRPGRTARRPLGKAGPAAGSRNEACPCGSGRKAKRCCSRRIG